MFTGNREEKGRPIKIKDEGLTLVNNVASIDLVGDGVLASSIGDDVTQNIPGTGLTDWLLNGNTLGSKKTLGSIDDYDIGFITNNTEKMTILADGNVGIGTTAPLLPLHVNGKVVIGDSVTTGRLNSNFGPRALNLIDTNGTVRIWRYSSNSAMLELGAGVNNTFFNNNVWAVAARDPARGSGLSFIKRTGSDTHIMFLSDTGNVGIGTTNPIQKLTIGGDSGTAYSLINSISFERTAYAPGQSAAEIQFYRHSGSSEGELAFATSPLFGNLSERMRINRDGNVGIGTTNPTRKLTVVGNSAEIFLMTGPYNNALMLQDVLSYGGMASFLGYNGTVYNPIEFRAQAGVGSQLYLATTGNVGIGKTNPGVKLDVSGQGRFQSTVFPVVDIIRDTTTTGTSIYGGAKLERLTTTPINNGGIGFYFKYPNSTGVSTFAGLFGGALSNITNGAEVGDIVFGAAWKGVDPASNKHLIIRATGTTTGNVLVPNGNVGIGTTNPNQQLEITKNFRLPATVGTDAYGVIYKDGDRFIHDFNYGDNGTVTTAGYNIFIGINAGNFTMGSSASTVHDSSYNTGIGAQALLNNTTGSYNSAIGMQALYSNTTGGNNFAIGMRALYRNTTGNYNSAIGGSALYSNTTGSYNSAIGLYALQYNTTGSSNSAIGLYAGRYLSDGTTGRETGNNGLYLGSNSKASNNGTENEIVIGANAIGKGSNTAAYGNISMLKHIFEAGNVGIGTTTPTAKLDVDSDILRLRVPKTPETSGSSSNQGDIFWDDNYLYIATSTNTIKRIPLEAF